MPGGGDKSQVRNRKQGGKPQPQPQQDMIAAGKPKKGKGKKKSATSIAALAGCGLVALAGLLAMQWYLTESVDPSSSSQGADASGLTRPPKVDKPKKGSSKSSRAAAKRRDSLEWRRLPRDMAACLAQQEELMTVPVNWPGFHAFCIEAVDADSVTLTTHNKSGQVGATGTRPLVARSDGGLVSGLLAQLQEELADFEFRETDPMISTSAYEFPPNPWRLFTAVGGPVEEDGDLLELGAGAMLYLYTGGQFIWPGVRIGHKTRVPVPVRNDDGSEGEKWVELETVSLRPNVLVLSNFLSDEECDFIKGYARTRMVPSGLAMMDSSGDSRDVRTSTQTFMERGGTQQIKALESRAHNLTRLPYELGENIQVVRYEEGQKYGAHRDFFNPNDYHRQPHMLQSVEYGARNRLATVFWYLESIEKGHGGETFFPRALNEQGKEYKPWNGDHEDCYRGIAVTPVRGNAVLFYSMVPDGRLDERSLHGGCKPKGSHIEKWGANQWIWNHPKRHRGTYPRKGARKPKASKAGGGKPGCEDSDENCAAWAESGECSKNPDFMQSNCRASCGTC